MIRLSLSTCTQAFKVLSLCVTCLMLSSCCGTPERDHTQKRIHQETQEIDQRSYGSCKTTDKDSGCPTGTICCALCCGMPVPKNDPRLTQGACKKPVPGTPAGCEAIP